MEQLPNETKKAWQAFQDFVKLGGNRDLKVLLNRYRDQDGSKEIPPTTSKSTIGNWSYRYNWTERANAYDAEQALIAAQRVKEEEEVEHVKQLKAFRKAGDMAAVSSMSIASATLIGNRDKVAKLLMNMQLPEEPTVKELMEILMVMEKAQAIAEKAIAQKSQLEGFDKIAKFLEANGHG